MRGGGKIVSVLCQSVWKYLNPPEATELRRRRTSIKPEKRCYQLVW